MAFVSSMWTRRGTFDGIRRMYSATNPSALTQATGAVSANVPALKQQIQKNFEAAKRQNEQTQSILMEYHKSFAALYQASENIRLQQRQDFKEKIEMIQDELQNYKRGQDPHFVVTTAEFVPKDVEVKEDIQYYIIKAIQEGKTLAEVMPPTLLAQRLDAYSSGSSSACAGGSSQASTVSCE